MKKKLFLLLILLLASPLINRALAKENKDTNIIYLQLGINSGLNITNRSFIIDESYGWFGRAFRGRFQQNSFVNIPSIAIIKNYENLFFGFETSYGIFYKWEENEQYKPGYRGVQFLEKIPYTFTETTAKSYVNLKLFIDQFPNKKRKNSNWISLWK
jgi:hypothetical protein